jgi:hypothetical protein
LLLRILLLRILLLRVLLLLRIAALLRRGLVLALATDAHAQNRTREHAQGLNARERSLHETLSLFPLSGGWNFP